MKLSYSIKSIKPVQSLHCFEVGGSITPNSPTNSLGEEGEVGILQDHVTLGPVEKVSGHPSSLSLEAQVCQILPDYGLVWRVSRIVRFWLIFLELEEEVVD